MKRIFVYVLVLLSFCSCHKKKQDFICISQENPSYLEYADGSPYIPVGPNICWERFETEETKILDLYELRFKKLAENGGNYTRIWLSAPFFEIEHSKAGEYDDTIVERIDKLLDLALKYGIKIKFCLENFRKIAGSPAPFSTSVPFDKPIYGVEMGGSIENMDDYFDTSAGKSLYLGRIAYLSSKYAKHPAILGWELWNEVNSVSYSGGNEKLLEWTDSMLPEVKSYFPNHLVMQSLGSFDRESFIEMYEHFSLLKENDIAQVHRYLDPGATWDICQAPMDSLAANAVSLIRRVVKDKPVILSEVGAVEAHHSGPSKLYEKDSLGILLHDLLFAPFFSGAAAPGQSWHWSYYIEKNDLWWHFRRFSTAIKGINPIKEHFEPEFFYYDRVRIYCLKGKSSTLIWCRDALNDWKSELIDNIKPEYRIIKLPVTFLQGKLSKIRLFDPWSDKWMDGVLKNDSISLKFCRSIIIRSEITD